jgi:protein-disulfide isomerase
MVYNWRDDTRLGGTTLIGTGPGVCKTARATLALLILAALAVTVIVGCGAGSGGSSQPSGKQQASGTPGSQGQEAEDTGSSGRVSGGREGHPTLGSADAPVVLTEYSDYQ